MDKQTLEIQCVNNDCKKTFVVEIPVAEVINTATISGVIWTHPEAQGCPFCGLSYQMRLMRVEAPQLRFDPIRMRSDASRIAVPPPGLKLPPIPGNH